MGGGSDRRARDQPDCSGTIPFPWPAAHNGAYPRLRTSTHESLRAGYLCLAFVFVGSILLSITALLFIVGLIWSCTRGWAALLLIVMSLIGNVLLFGGIIGLAIYLGILALSFYAYFSWAPGYYKERGLEKPSWLQAPPAPPPPTPPPPPPP